MGLRARSIAGMSPIPKSEFPPLFPPGFYPKTLEELRGICVANFPLSSTRVAIMTGLEAVLDRLNEAKVTCEAWIDGSFLTQKIDPEDVDFVLRIAGDFCDSLTTEQVEVLNWLTSEIPHEEHRCHGFVLSEYAKDHPNYWQGEWMRGYWIRQFGFSRGHEMKGMVVLKLPLGDV